MYYGTLKKKQDVVLNALRKYSPKNQKHIKAKNKLLDNAKDFHKGRKNIIEGFKNKIFPIWHDNEDSRFKDNDQKSIRDNNGLINYEKLNRLINLKRRSINDSFLDNTLNIKIQTVSFKI